MKFRDPETGEFTELYLEPAGDTLPIGSIVDYDGDTVPAGYEEVNDNKDYITVYASQDEQTIEMYDKVPFNTIKTKSGNKLTFENNEITIGAGVHNIRISGAVNVASDKRLWAKLIVGNIDQANCIGRSTVDGFYTLVYPQQIIPVTEGNKIYIMALDEMIINSGGISGKTTYLCVEVID